MKQEEKILLLLTEGGSVDLVRSGNKFYYSTLEAATLDLLDEDDMDESMLQKTVHTFDSFDAAFDNLLDRYPVFRFSPYVVHPEFRGRIRERYLHYKNDNPEESTTGWDKFLT